jgi:hypothetical protein
MQGNRLILESSTKLNVSTVVSVEYEDTLFLGEVVGLNSVPAGYAICIFVKQALTGLQSLLTLRSQLGGEASPALVGKSPVLESAKLH